jgi:NTP pyrophosphatase (non-canonical NTP hydrolase)
MPEQPRSDTMTHHIAEPLDTPAGPPTQAEVGVWLDQHFPNRTLDQQVLVLAEEVGEVARAVVKRAQGVRGSHAEWTTQLHGEVADVLLTCLAIAATEGFDLSGATARKWATIQRRDPTAIRAAHQPTTSVPAGAEYHADTATRTATRTARAGRSGWENQVRAAIGGMFPPGVARQIISSDAFGALAYRLGQHAQDTDATAEQVLGELDLGDREFAARADDPAAFLARKVAEL